MKCAEYLLVNHKRGDKMANEEEPKSNQSTKQVWENVKTAVENIFNREITSQEFYYLLSLYPYLEICDADYPYLDEGAIPKIIMAENGWRIFDFDTVLTAGAYELFCRPKVKNTKEEDTDGDNGDNGDNGDGGGHGTIVKQYADIAFEMIDLAIQKGWTGAEIISGFYPMQRIAWIAAAEKGYELKGFEPTPEDYVVQSWVTRIREKKLYPPGKPFMKGAEKTPKR